MIPVIFAHRGSSGEAPENTMSAFRLAIEQQAEGIELDVQMTIDKKIIVMHDEAVDRTTNGTGLIASQTYNRLKRLDASYKFPAYRGEPVPLLSQVMELLAPTTLQLNIELKNSVILYEGMEEAVVSMVREYGMASRTVFSSFNHYSIAKLAKLAPEIEGAILYSEGLFEPWVYAAKLGARALHCRHNHAVPSIVERTHRAGMKIRPYTVNSESALKKFIAMGVDGIITNYPARMARIREEMQKGNR